MTIKDRFRRALRKSDSSSSLSHSDTNTTANTANTSQSSLSAIQSLSTFASQQDPKPSAAPKLTKTFTWGHREKDPEKEKAREERRKAKKRGSKPVHPSEKPLTAQNLRHQEMLSHFTMTFGATRNEHLGAPSLGGVSPCCTRPASIIDTDEYGP